MNEYFTVLFYDGITYSDISLKLKDFSTAAVSNTLLDSNYYYVGYRKPFNQFYVELDTLNTVANTLNFEYWNGTTWTSLNAIDETEGYTKSGFIYFDKSIAYTASDAWNTTTVGASKLYWIRFQPSVSHDAGEVRGLNILLSNDEDLKSIRANIISKHLPSTLKSWVLKHEEARKSIIQSLRNAGNKKVITINGLKPYLLNRLLTDELKDITEFDLHDWTQLRQASKYKAISLIYLNELSDEADDKWERAGIRYEIEAEKAMNLYFLSLDKNDDGIEDDDEQLEYAGTNLTWQ